VSFPSFYSSLPLKLYFQFFLFWIMPPLYNPDPRGPPHSPPSVSHPSTTPYPSFSFLRSNLLSLVRRLFLITWYLTIFFSFSHDQAPPSLSFYGHDNRYPRFSRLRSLAPVGGPPFCHEPFFCSRPDLLFPPE